MQMTKDIIDILLDEREWQTFDCKRADISPSKILETICAFANSEGGGIALGLEDPGKGARDKRVLGIVNNEDKVSEILNLVEKEFEPPLNDIRVSEIKVINNRGLEDKVVLLRVQKGRDVHSLKKGDTFVRRGNQNHKIGAQEITRLRYEKGALKFEDEIAQNLGIDDLEVSLLERYKSDTGSQENDNWQFLKDNGLAIRHGKEIVLTKAGTLLFGKNPAVAMKSKCGVKISHYYGKSRSYTGTPNFVQRPFTIEGPLIRQIEEAVLYYKKAVASSPPKLVGANFLPTLLIPEWAFQEAITNAVIHRNYFTEDDIHVRIFDDRIEIESPGTYPGFITPQNIRTERFARNIIIQRTLNRFNAGPNLDIGEGVDRMFQVMKENNLYEPVYFPASKRPNSVELHLFNMQKIDYWDTVSNYLDKNYRINNQATREITSIGDSSKVSRLLKQWVIKGLIEKIDSGYKGNIYYRKLGAELPDTE